MHINNKAAWVETFTVAESVLSIKTGLSGRGVRNARNELKQKGRIDFKSRVGGKAPIYTIISFETGINYFNKNSVTKRVPFSDVTESPEVPTEMYSEGKTSTEMSSVDTSAGASVGCAGDTSGGRATLIDIDKDIDNIVVEKENKEKENWSIALEYFCQKSGRADTNLRTREREAAQEICEEVPSLDTVLKGIDYAFDNFQPDSEDDKINSFCYCAKVIKGLWKRENSKKNGGGKRGSSKQDTDSGEDSSPYDFSKFEG
ncbi:hypothetical protein ACJDU8_19800 [Clostridium sp. WILCCON 0269]|uniref:Helix-turn-helix domain-containing protein n=1 Tax=Candidatus Clostridium eludens TaxID=3381663 RepID=A0ABW8SR54_9CLOT